MNSAMSENYLIPLPGGERIVTISGPFPLSESEWNHFVVVLDAMKPGLVATTAPEGEE